MSTLVNWSFLKFILDFFFQTSSHKLHLAGIVICEKSNSNYSKCVGFVLKTAPFHAVYLVPLVQKCFHVYELLANIVSPWESSKQKSQGGYSLLINSISVPFHTAFNHKDFMHIQFDKIEASNQLSTRRSQEQQYGLISANILAGSEYHGASQGIRGFHIRFFTFLLRLIHSTEERSGGQRMERFKWQCFTCWEGFKLQHVLYFVLSRSSIQPANFKLA